MKLTTRDFLQGGTAPTDIRISLEIHANSASSREPVRLLLIGSRQGVNSIVHVLHQLRFAEVFEWSGALTAPDPDQPLKMPPGSVMRILTKYVPML